MVSPGNANLPIGETNPPIGRLAFPGLNLSLYRGRTQPCPIGQLSLVFTADTNH